MPLVVGNFHTCCMKQDCSARAHMHVHLCVRAAASANHDVRGNTRNSCLEAPDKAYMRHFIPFETCEQVFFFCRCWFGLTELLLPHVSDCGPLFDFIHLSIYVHVHLLFLFLSAIHILHMFGGTPAITIQASTVGVACHRPLRWLT